MTPQSNVSSGTDRFRTDVALIARMQVYVEAGLLHPHQAEGKGVLGMLATSIADVHRIPPPAALHACDNMC